MNPSSQPSPLQEVYLQEAELKTLNDASLPVICIANQQVIAEQSEEAEEHLAPRYIP